MSSAGHFHMYPVTRIKSTKTLDISRNFSYFLNLQYESRRLTSYLFKVNIDRTVVQLEDGRTDGRNTFSFVKSNDETRQHRKISVVSSADVELRMDDCQPCKILILNDHEWEIIEFLVHFLHPFQIITTLVQGTSEPSLHNVWVKYEEIFDKLDEVKNALNELTIHLIWLREVQVAIEKMWEKLKDYYSK